MNAPEKRIVDFINEHHVLTLATSINDMPYCANCFYAYSQDDNFLIFTSDKDTRHASEGLANENVALSIVLETKTIGKIQGVQICGKLKVAKEETEKKMRKIYLKKFPYAILKKTNLWIVDIEYIKMTDNRLGFGKKIIWEK